MRVRPRTGPGSGPGSRFRTTSVFPMRSISRSFQIAPSFVFAAVRRYMMIGARLRSIRRIRRLRVSVVSVCCHRLLSSLLVFFFICLLLWLLWLLWLAFRTMLMMSVMVMAMAMMSVVTTLLRTSARRCASLLYFSASNHNAVPQRLVLRVGWLIFYLPNELHSPDYLSKYDMLAVEVRTRDRRYKELRAVRVWTGVCHG